MEALLVDEWVDPATAIEMIDGASVALARERVRELGRERRLPAEVVEPMVLVASELGRNQLAHARGGRMEIRAVEREGIEGLEVVAADRGAGILDPTTAFEGRPRPSGSLGVGLASACDLAFEVDADVRLGEGTCIWARKFAGEVRRRRQIGIMGRPHPDERRSGDHACFRRSGTDLTVGVCDGLGHGAPAREASSAAFAAFRTAVARSPAEILEISHAALHRTRGVVMAVARIDEHTGALDVGSVGNIGVHVYGFRTGRRFGGSSFVLGAPQRVRKIREETATLEPHETLVMFTDGVTSRLALEDELDLFRRHPLVVAHQILERFARDDDDVLVLVAG